MQSKLTLIGLYNYDNSLFDYLSLPTGIDTDTVKDQILIRCGEFELLYPDFDFMKLSIAHFSKKHYRTFEKWITALNIQYDPLYNYDRKEEYTDTSSAAGNTTGKSKPAQTTNTSTNQVSAFDSTGYQPKEQTTDQVTVNTQAEDSTSTNSNSILKHDAHLYGNIGVTTSQQMLQSELDIARFNIAEQIADLFVEEYCLMIY